MQTLAEMCHSQKFLGTAPADLFSRSLPSNIPTNIADILLEALQLQLYVTQYFISLVLNRPFMIYWAGFRQTKIADCLRFQLKSLPKPESIKQLLTQHCHSECRYIFNCSGQSSVKKAFKCWELSMLPTGDNVGMTGSAWAGSNCYHWLATICWTTETKTSVR